MEAMKSCLAISQRKYCFCIRSHCCTFHPVCVLSWPISSRFYLHWISRIWKKMLLAHTLCLFLQFRLHW